jgi:hypothetical protein
MDGSSATEARPGPGLVADGGWPTSGSSDHRYSGDVPTRLKDVEDAASHETSSDASNRPKAPYIVSSDGSVRLGETVAGPLSVPLGGARVVQCQFDHAFSLVLDEDEPGRSWVVRVGAPFSVADTDGRMTSFVDDAAPSAWGPAVDALLHATVVDARVAANGTLTLQFREGPQLNAPPLTQWEAWQITGPDGVLVVCAPGGGISRWPAATDEIL